MEISFKRADSSYSSKPPINKSSGRHSGNKNTVCISTTGSLNAQEAQERMRSFFREQTPAQNQVKTIQLRTPNTLKNDVFSFSGENAQSAKKIEQSCDNTSSKDAKHNLTQILLQPKKVKKQAAIYFGIKNPDKVQVSVDNSKKGRVKIKIKPLNVMA